MYILLTGIIPTIHELFQQSEEKDVYNLSFEFKEWNEISDQAKDMIKRMIVLDPEKRLSASEALQHRWFRILSSDSTEADSDFDHNELLKSLKNIGEDTLLKGELCNYLLDRVPNDKLDELKKELNIDESHPEETLTNNELLEAIRRVDCKLLNKEIMQIVQNLEYTGKNLRPYFCQSYNLLFDLNLQLKLNLHSI